MAVERRYSRSHGDVVGTGAGMLRVTGWKYILLVYAEGDDDVDEGDDDVGEAEALIRRDLERVPFGNSSSYLATRAVAIPHSLGRGGADDGAGAAISAVVRSGGVFFGGGGAELGSGGVIFGYSATRAPSGVLDLVSGAVSSSIRPRSLSWCGRTKARNSDGGKEVALAVWARPPSSSGGSRSEVRLARLVAAQ